MKNAFGENFGEKITRNVIAAVHAQLKRYYAGCNKDRTYTTAVENIISNRLLKDLENLIADDMYKGGVHSLQRAIINDEPILMIDKEVVFSSWKGSEGIARKKYALRDDYDRIKEGNILLQMIDDLETLSQYKFVDKYCMEKHLKGSDEFAKKLLDNFYNPEDFVDFATSTIDCSGTSILDDKAKIAVMQFLFDNPDSAMCSYENGQLHVSGHDIDRVGIDIWLFRENINSPFYMRKFKVMLFIESRDKEFLVNSGSHIGYELQLSDKARLSLGTSFYYSTYKRFEAECFEFERQLELKRKKREQERNKAAGK